MDQDKGPSSPFNNQGFGGDTQGFGSMPDNQDGFETIQNLKWEKAFDYRLPLELIDVKKLEVDPDHKRMRFVSPQHNEEFFVEVKDPRKKSEGMFSSHFDFQLLASFGPDSASKKIIDVRRRFSQFEELYEHLKTNFPSSIFPHLPPKSLATATTLIDNSEFIENRTKALDCFMKKLLTHHNVLGKEPDHRLLNFLDKNSDSTKIGKLSKSIMGTAHQGMTKTKGMFNKLFGQSQSNEFRYEYGGHEEDEIKELKDYFNTMSISLGNLVTKLKEVVAKLEKKIEGLLNQSQLMLETSQTQGLIENFQLEPNQITWLGEAHEKTQGKLTKYVRCLREYFIFYFEDLRDDVTEAAGRISDRIGKADQIRTNALNVKEMDQLQNIWDQHRFIVEQMVGEARLYKTQAQESFRTLFRLLNECRASHYAEVAPIWQNRAMQ